ncbi:hypothetical protein AB0I39_28025 [Kitasatospora purpeofusca]|uniref:hypothetical protein n=1 Tax=Kitasatospora purpeofusca TaxID=67352 RepID=UPI0033E1B8B0
MAGRKKAGIAEGLAEDLSRFLRQLRALPDGSMVTYAEMADRLGGRRYCSAATLSRADLGGDQLPRIETVTGYVKACGGTPGHLQHAHRLLATAQRKNERARTAARFDDPKQGARAALQQHPATPRHPDYMRTPLDFQQGLQGYRQETGGLSMQAIARNAQASGLYISKSTVHRMLSPGIFPQWHQVAAFLTGCRPHRLPDLQPWRRAWRRLFAPSAAPSPSPPVASNSGWHILRELLTPTRKNTLTTRYGHVTADLEATWSTAMSQIPVRERAGVLREVMKATNADLFRAASADLFWWMSDTSTGAEPARPKNGT